MDSLADSIDALYAAFRDVPKPRTIEGCPCCIDDKDICTLLSRPLRELTGGELSSYSSSAFWTVGDQADYLYFLPRIIDIACTESGWWPDIEVTGRAIGKTRPWNWAKSRRDTLIDVIRSVIAAAVSDENGCTIDEWICASAKMGLDVGIFLEEVAQSPEALLSYYEHNSEPLIRRKLGNAFWDQDDEWHDKIVSWFSSPRISRLISDCYGLTTNTSEQ